MAHNPEVEGSNPSPATRQNGPGSIVSRGRFLLLVTKLLVPRGVRSLGASPRVTAGVTGLFRFVLRQSGEVLLVGGNPGSPSSAAFQRTRGHPEQSA